MKTKKSVLGVASIIIILLVVSFVGISSRNQIAGLFTRSLEVESETQSDNVTQQEYSVNADDLVLYNSQDYSFRHPKNWIVQKDSDSYVRISNFDPSILKDPDLNRSIVDYFKIEIVKLDNSNNLILDQWVNNFITTSYPLPEISERKNIKVSGLSAIYLLESYGSKISPAIYVAKGDSVYILNISTNYKNFSFVIDIFIQSFKFNNSA